MFFSMFAYRVNQNLAAIAPNETIIARILTMLASWTAERLSWLHWRGDAGGVCLCRPHGVYPQ
jgi:hypothetical protein